MHSRKFVTHVGSSTLTFLALTAAVAPEALAQDDERFAAAHASLHRPGDGSGSGNDLVRIVREATARFRDVAAAEAEYYKLNFGCVSGSDAGAMGLHYVNMDLVMDGKLDPWRPEIVIYEPLPDGRRRLIGADYLVLAEAWHAKYKNPPELKGQLLHLFESPNRFGLPAFYTLHVWAWKDNPTGMFVNWHTNVSCEGYDGPGR
jgi:hypothetical protein